jgi:MFS family permease
VTTTQSGDLPDWLVGERARPTLPAAAGAAGALVALVGMFLLLEEVDPEDLRAFGLALSSFTLLVGCFMAFVERRGALRTAGVGLAAGAVLPLALALVNDPNEIDSRTDVLITGLVAVAVWLALFLFSPARGHGVFLGLALLAAWFAAVSQTAPERALFWFTPFAATEASTRTETLEAPSQPPQPPPPSIVFPDPPALTTPTFTIPRTPPPSFPEPTFRSPVVPEPQPVEPTFPFPTFEEQPQPQQGSLGRITPVSSSQSIERPPEPPIAPAVVSILFGVVYLALAALLDQARLTRLAGAFTAVGVPVLALGVVFVGPRHGAVAVSVAAVAFGAVLLAVGVGGARRFSAWAGAAVLAGGAIGLVGEAFDDPGSGDALAMLLTGAALVAAGWFLSQPAGGSSSPPVTADASPR